MVPKAQESAHAPLLAGQYRLGERSDVRGPVEWFAGVRYGSEAADVAPVILAREPRPADPKATRPWPAPWPSLAWEDDLRRRARHLGLPRVVDSFADGDW